MIIYRPRERWKKNRSIDEQPLLHHAEYMDTLPTKGQLVAGEPFTDNSGGIAIVLAKNFQEAQTLLQAEPAVKQKAFEASVHPCQVLFEQSLKT